MRFSSFEFKISLPDAKYSGFRLNNPVFAFRIGVPMDLAP
jgi:hypothetical protein